MTQRKINARDMVFEVESATPNTWLPVERLSSFTVNFGENEETTETTDYESEGAYEGEIMQRGASISMEGQALEDDTTGALPAGRARVEAMCAEDKVGSASLGRVRFRSPNGTTWRIWTCFFSLGEQGGGNNDKLSWSATVTKSGKTTTAPVEDEE